MHVQPDDGASRPVPDLDWIAELLDDPQPVARVPASAAGYSGQQDNLAADMTGGEASVRFADLGQRVGPGDRHL